MKYCIKCGQQLAADQRFCTHCGAEQPAATEADSQTATTEPATSADETTDQDQAETTVEPDTETTDHSLTWIVIGLIIVVLIGWAGVKSYQTYKRNHLTEQELANIGGDVADNYLGKDVVTVYYGKEDNELDLVAKSGTGLYNRADDVVNGYISANRLTSYVGKFKKISTAMSKKMPTDLRDVRVRFMNPESTNRYLYVTQNGEVTYDFTTDDD